VGIALEPDAALKRLAQVSVKDTTSCNGKRACLAELGRQLAVPWVVALSAATLDDELSVGLELIRVADETVVETTSVLVPRKSRLDPALLQAFAAKVVERLAPPPPTPQLTDAPRATNLTPPPVEPPPLPPPPLPEARSHTASFVLVGAGVAALVAGGVLLGVGVANREALTAGQPGATDPRVRSTLTIGEAEALNTSTSALIGAGIGGLVLGAGLGTAGVLTW
jgi:hypothetical protein